MTKKIQVTLGVLAVIFLAYLTPMILISNGVARYSTDQKRYAQQAIDDTELHLSSPSFYKLYTTKIAVGDLQPTGNKNCPYTSKVTLYTLMGLQYATYDVDPGCTVNASNN